MQKFSRSTQNNKLKLPGRKYKYNKIHCFAEKKPWSLNVDSKKQCNNHYSIKSSYFMYKKRQWKGSKNIKNKLHHEGKCPPLVSHLLVVFAEQSPVEELYAAFKTSQRFGSSYISLRKPSILPKKRSKRAFRKRPSEVRRLWHKTGNTDCSWD